MAVRQKVVFSRTLIGDGSSTSCSIDLYEEIASTNILPRGPSSIYFIASTVTPSISSSSLIGNVVIINFDGVVDSGSLTISLLF